MHPFYVEEILYSIMFLTQYDQIKRENWIEIARILSMTDTSQFKEKLFFVQTEVERIQFIIDNMCVLTNINDETYIEILESKLINQTTVKIEYLSQMSYDEIKNIEKMLHYHPFFAARGNAFIILAAIDHCDHKVIINTMNTLLDENVVKEYSVIGFSLIHLSSNELIDDLLESLQSESAIKTYEILKLFTEFTLDEKIDTKGKSKIINYLAKEITQLKSKKPVNYYYTDIKIPFTTTLKDELYKAWIKIQGLSGKTQYSIKNG
ncbi:unnamed protein product [Rotaria sp. Silwood2]|nr:unnamed protein product [Rotaria sp. Silwood2]